jgi:hypothetical protein
MGINFEPFFSNEIKSVVDGTKNLWDSAILTRFFEVFSHILIEMYTILRIFKRNSNDNNQHNQSALSLVYMGDKHSTNIKDIILKLAPYTLEKSIIGEGNNSRCLDFSSFRLDLTEDLTEELRNRSII